MIQFPVGARIEITECPVMKENFQLSITKQGFGIHSTIPKDISNIDLLCVITDQILDFNRSAPMDSNLDELEPGD